MEEDEWEEDDGGQEDEGENGGEGVGGVCDEASEGLLHHIDETDPGRLKSQWLTGLPCCGGGGDLFA